MSRNINLNVNDWESWCVRRSLDPDDPGYVITVTYLLEGGDVILRRERRVRSSQLSAARQTGLAGFDTDILARMKAAEGV